MKILVTGAGGQLGHDVVDVLQAKGHEVVRAPRAQLDVTDERAVRRLILSLKPEAVIHAAAYTDVDGCEQDPERAERVNALGTLYIARAAQEVRAKLVYISTDYVFDGTKPTPYEEDDLPHPINVYGRTKLEGERFAREVCPKSFIVRTAWLYGLHGRNFVKTMLRLARTRRELTVVHDQRGTPTWTRDLARQLAVLLPTEHYGVYHASAQGSCSWYEFAVTIFQALSMEVRVRPVTSEEFPRPARRPKNSVLENRRLQELGLDLLPPWEEAFHRFLKELAERGPLPG